MAWYSAKTTVVLLLIIQPILSKNTHPTHNTHAHNTHAHHTHVPRHTTNAASVTTTSSTNGPIKASTRITDQLKSNAAPQTPKVATSTKDVRLIGGDNDWSGRVEVYRNDTWGTVCGYGFGTREVDVTCRSLGYFDGGWLFYDAAFGEGNDSIIIENLRCQGNETDLSQCDVRYLTPNTYCHHRNDISISCRVGKPPSYTEGVRLVGGDHAWSGRVEVFHNGHWGTVCDFLFDDREAEVVCRMLGYHSGGWAFASGVFGYGSGPMWAGSLNCLGNETDLKQCPSYSEWGRASCVHKQDASVSCRNGSEANITAVRLVGPLPNVGRVEIKHNGHWGTLCSNHFDSREAEVVCRMLGYDEDGWALRPNTFGPGKGPIWLADLECTGRENDLEECESFNWAGHRCRHDQDAVVWCANETRSNDTAVRLEGGKFKWDGRLEVRHKGEWGTVCDNLFDELDADVVCRKMGFKYGGTVLRNAMYGKGSIRVWLDALECQGNETDISFCPFEEWGTTNCSHDNDVGIYCRTTAQRTHLAGLSERDILGPHCRRFAFDTRLYLPPLIDEYPDFNTDDIYMGTEKCKGVVDGPYLKFQHSFATCQTAVNITSDTYIYYSNIITYAVDQPHPHAGHGPGTKDIRLSFDVSCKWTRTGSAQEHFFHIQNPDKNNPDELPTTSAPISRNSIEIELYTDPHFHHLKPVYGSQPGDLIYVKAYSLIDKHDVRMKMTRCFLTTHPRDRNVYYIMKDGCMLDPNAAMISEKTHETTFYFEDMQLPHNPRSLYIICSFTICNTNEHNSTCDQTCNTQKHGGHRSRAITLDAPPLEAYDETDNIISKPIREEMGANFDVAYGDLPPDLERDLPSS